MSKPSTSEGIFGGAVLASSNPFLILNGRIALDLVSVCGLGTTTVSIPVLLCEGLFVCSLCSLSSLSRSRFLASTLCCIASSSSFAARSRCSYKSSAARSSLVIALVLFFVELYVYFSLFPISTFPARVLNPTFTSVRWRSPCAPGNEEKGKPEYLFPKEGKEREFLTLSPLMHLQASFPFSSISLARRGFPADAFNGIESPAKDTRRKSWKLHTPAHAISPTPDCGSRLWLARRKRTIPVKLRPQPSN